MRDYPDQIVNVEALDEFISRPGRKVIEMFAGIDGDILFLGISGKIGPSLSRMAKRACEEAKVKKKITGVALFESEDKRKEIENTGIETIHGDLLDEEFIRTLPPVRNVFFLAGMKFGSEENLSLTWAVNSFLPGMVAGYFKDSRIVVFSTGCVYPLVPVESGGSLETDHPGPVGEYAQSCLGRERMFEYGSTKNSTKISLIRLNYSVELRYGVLVDIALKVKRKEPVDLSMGYFNVIWQGDMNNMVLCSLEQCSSPPKIINITGPEILSVREVALEFGNLFGIKPVFVNKEAETALLSNSQMAYSLLGRPEVPVKKVIDWTGSWVNENRTLLGKPTHFEVRDGKY
jgi:dTDP-4-dehydrorhamnose reductase